MKMQGKPDPCNLNLFNFKVVLTFPLLKWQRQIRLVLQSLYLEFLHMFYDEFIDPAGAA